MKVLWRGCGDRLTDLDDPERREIWAAGVTGERFLLVWHIGSSDQVEIVKESQTFLGAHPKCRGILFVRGQPHVSAVADAVSYETGSRAHCLSYSVPEGGKSNEARIVGLFRAFVKAVAELPDSDGSRIPWEVVEPVRWPEYVVALYLGLVAAERIEDHAQRDAILQALPWAEAQREFQKVPGTPRSVEQWTKENWRQERVLDSLRALVGR